MFSRKYRFSLLATGAVATSFAFFFSCSNDKKSNKDEEQPPRIVFPNNPPPNGTPGPGTGVGPGGGAFGLDGKWVFTGFSCTSGEITPWAELENALVSDNGQKSPEFQWSTGGTDRGVIRRKHEWNIYGDTAIRESTLSFHSDTAANSEATAWVSTKKRYKLNRITNGRLVLNHGPTEGPFFQGLPLEPVFSIIEKQIDNRISRGGFGAALLRPVQNIQRLLQSQFSNRYANSILNFVNEISEATETVNYTFNQSTLTLSQATVNIKGFTSEPGVRLVDVTACGTEGQATRSYKKTGDAEPFF